MFGVTASAFVTRERLGLQRQLLLMCPSCWDLHGVCSGKPLPLKLLWPFQGLEAFVSLAGPHRGCLPVTGAKFPSSLAFLMTPSHAVSRTGVGAGN